MPTLFSKQLTKQQPLATRIFQSAISANKLAKAYMLVGHTNEAKWQLVLQLAAYLNCQKVDTNNDRACLINESSSMEAWCTNCRWLQEDKHPQALMRLSSTSKSGKIAVEQARHFADEVSKTSPYFRVMIIEESNQEILHRPAANALLKTIEEPRSKVLMIFFAQATNDVLPTIKSRCQAINMTGSQHDKCLSLSSPNTIEQSLITEQPGNNSLTSISTPLEKFASLNSTLLDAIALGEAIQLLLKEGVDLELTLDYLVTKELLSINNIFAGVAEARYAKELFLLSQIANEQSKHYVSEKALVESFVFAWHKLKHTGVNPLKLQR